MYYSDSHKALVDFADRLLNYGIQCRHFWQYNLQSRGPKARRVFAPIDETDFHILSKCVDPVNDNIDSSSADNSSLMRQNRKGSFLPDAVRLLSIGSRIERLENKHKILAVNNSKMKKIIGKEKNKIASRVCRLRRKAQHESNKIKLRGLDREHGIVSLSLLLCVNFHPQNFSINLFSCNYPESVVCTELNCIVQLLEYLWPTLYVGAVPNGMVIAIEI